MIHLILILLLHLGRENSKGDHLRQFSFEEKQILINYYYANKCLAYCLNYASPEVRCLLIPIEEIEKRPFNN